MRRWLTLAALLLPWTLAAQTGVTVTAIWDLDPSHDAPGLTWELERDGVIHPCGPVTVTATDRRCAATVPAFEGTYRLRGVTASGEAGPWSVEGSGTQTAPGQFTITWHSPITLTPPEPTEMAVAYVSSASQTADLTSAGGNVDATLDAGTGSNRVVYAYVVWRFDRGTLTGVTYNGVSLTAVGSTANSGNFRGALYRLVGPTTGSNTLRASFTGSGNFPVWLTGISLDGVDGTTPDDTMVHEVESGSDTNTSQSVSTSSATDDRVLTGAWFATIGFDTTGSVVGSSYTIRQQVLHGGAGARLIIGDADGAATVTPTTSYNNVGAWSALRWALNVNAAGGGGAQAVSLPHLASGTQFHAPTLAYRVAPPALASGSTLHAPAVVPEGALTLPTIAAGSQLFSPALAYALALPTIPAGSSLHAPSLALALALPAIPSGSQLRAPSLAYLVQLPTVDSGSQLHPPALSTGNNLLLPAIPSGSTLHAPATAYAVSLPLIAAGSQLHAPFLTQGALLPPSIPSGAQLFGPTLAYAVSLPAIPSSVTLNPPSLSLGVTLPAIPSGSTLHPPAVTSFTITLPTLASTVVLYAPSASGGETDALIITLDADAWSSPRLASASWTVPVLRLGGFTH